MASESSDFSFGDFLKDGIGAVKDIAITKYQADVSESAVKQAQLQSAQSGSNTVTTTGGNVDMPGMSSPMMIGGGLLIVATVILLVLRR